VPHSSYVVRFRNDRFGDLGPHRRGRADKLKLSGEGEAQSLKERNVFVLAVDSEVKHGPFVDQVCRPSAPAS
jgi:hypothetical protein